MWSVFPLPAKTDGGRKRQFHCAMRQLPLGGRARSRAEPPSGSTNLTTNNIHKLRHGQRQNPGIQTMQAVGVCLGVDQVTRLRPVRARFLFRSPPCRRFFRPPRRTGANPQLCERRCHARLGQTPAQSQLPLHQAADRRRG